LPVNGSNAGRPRGSAFELAAKLLGMRAHGRAELKRKLLARGFGSGEVESALDECSRLGFLDDLAFAKSLASEMRGRGYGPARIALAFRRKGLDRELSKEALQGEDAPSKSDELQTAVEALRRKAKTFAREPDPRKRKLKAMRFLAARGFGSGVSSEACSIALGPSGFDSFL